MSLEKAVPELKKAFYAQIQSLQTTSEPNTSSTLDLLTKEEIKELEALWVEWNVYKRKQGV
ncbi:hypothetical protein [Vibrio mexicanus]|uniref:hypothetical protein n=1 Tax=Vibrio mexicanus TaxID=1004326 RepID=UPI00063C3057|nr:hypothetical protein [Vibrio mexicanus]